MTILVAPAAPSRAARAPATAPSSAVAPEAVAAAAVIADRLNSIGQQEFANTFGGIVMSPDGTGVHVYLTSMAASAVQPFLDAGNSSVPISFDLARRSMIDLETLTSRVGNDLDWLSSNGVSVTRYGPDVATGKVKIGVATPLSNAITNMLRARYGSDAVDAYALSDYDATIVHWYDRANDVSPWNGGDAIYLDNGLRAGDCTLGYGIVFPGGSRGILTAGHCSYGEAGSWEVYNANHADLSNRVGPVVSNKYNDTYIAGVAPIDTALIRGRPNGAIWVGSASSPVGATVDGAGGNYQNEVVCQSGARSGQICNLKVLDVNFCQPDSDNTSGHVCGLDDAKAGSGLAGHPGDSGAPVYRRTSGGSLYGVGLVEGGNNAGTVVYYTGMTAILNAYGATLCLWSAC